MQAASDFAIASVPYGAPEHPRIELRTDQLTVPSFEKVNRSGFLDVGIVVALIDNFLADGFGYKRLSVDCPSLLHQNPSL